jgi:UDPglucose 6-dehydrogenase
MSTRIAVVGSGYVGLVTAACFAELGHVVVCVDVDADKIHALQKGEVPIYEEWLPKLMERHGGRRLKFTTSLPSAVEASSAIFIAVGTPSAENGEADLSYVESVTRDIARTAAGYRLIVEKSTVPVYTCEWIRQVMAMSSSAARFDVVSNPEFLREGTAVLDFLRPDRIVVGADSDVAAKAMQEIYAPLTSGAYYKTLDSIVSGAENGAELILTSTKSAELIKHASNAFLATKISFINAVASVCEKVGADVAEVVRGMGADTRIGPRFLNPGIGYGGSCFPKDLKALRGFAKEFGYEFRLLDEVISINENQWCQFLKKVRSAVWNLRGKHLAVLGVTFKGGTDDVRESPAITIIRALLQERCTVSAYDPAGSENAREILPASGIEFADNPYEAAQGADALLILTDWEQFRHLDLDCLRGGLNQPIVIDGRNLYDPKRMERAGLLYYSVGRSSPTLKTLNASSIKSQVFVEHNTLSAETLSTD